VYKIASERLPKAAVVCRSGRLLLTNVGVVCVKLDRQLPKEVVS
jgi:hypothetical protein